MEPITYQMIKKAVRQLKKNAYSYPAIPIHIGTGNGCIHYIAKTPEQAYDFIKKTVAAYAEEYKEEEMNNEA